MRNECPKGMSMVYGVCQTNSRVTSIGNTGGDSTMGVWDGGYCDSCMQSCFNQMMSCSGTYSYPLGGQCTCNQQCVEWVNWSGDNWGTECISYTYYCFYAGPSCGSQCASACPSGWGGVGPDPGGGRGGGTGRQ